MGLHKPFCPIPWQGVNLVSALRPGPEAGQHYRKVQDAGETPALPGDAQSLPSGGMSQIEACTRLLARCPGKGSTLFPLCVLARRRGSTICRFRMRARRPRSQGMPNHSPLEGCRRLRPAQGSLPDALARGQPCFRFASWPGGGAAPSAGSGCGRDARAPRGCHQVQLPLVLPEQAK